MPVMADVGFCGGATLSGFECNGEIFKLVNIERQVAIALGEMYPE